MFKEHNTKKLSRRQQTALDKKKTKALECLGDNWLDEIDNLIANGEYEQALLEISKLTTKQEKERLNRRYASEKYSPLNAKAKMKVLNLKTQVINGLLLAKYALVKEAHTNPLLHP